MLPSAMRAPGSRWPTEYPKAASGFAEFPAEFHSLEASLRRAGACLDVVLAGERTSGTWVPEKQAWTDTA